MKYFISVFLILISCTSCSNIFRKADEPIDLYTYKNHIYDSHIWVKIDDNFSEQGNTFSLNNNYEFLITSQSQESRDFWPHPMWKLEFDNDMPFVCIGKFKKSYIKSDIFKSIENFVNEAIEQEIEAVNCQENLFCEEIAIVSHTISYNLEAKYGDTDNGENSLYPSIYNREGKTLNGSTISYELLKDTKTIFDDAGLNVFKWRPKNYLFEKFMCSKN